MRNFILLLIFLLPFQIFSNDIVVISSDMYNVDKKNNLILINEKVDEINAKWTQTKEFVSIDNVQYRIDSPTEEFVIGQAYQITDNITTYTLYFTVKKKFEVL